jgi:hypothetical protein
VSIAINAGPSPSRATLLGLVLLAPAVLFLIVVLIEEGFGFRSFSAFMAEPQQRQIFNLISPIVFLGGLAAALLLNALAIAELDLRWQDSRLVTTLAIQPRTPNVALIVATALLLALFVGYALAENYAIVNTHV